MRANNSQAFEQSRHRLLAGRSRDAQRVSRLDGIYLGLAAFCARDMVPLRLAYGYGDRLWPIVILHAAMLPMNVVRLVQLIDGRRKASRVQPGKQSARRNFRRRPVARRPRRFKELVHLLTGLPLSGPIVGMVLLLWPCRSSPISVTCAVLLRPLSRRFASEARWRPAVTS